MVGLIAFGFQVPDGCWHWHSYSDIKRSSQMVAVACRQRSGPCVGPSHVFGDVLHRFPREVQEDLHKKSPTLKTPKEDALLQFLACRAVIESEISSFRPQLSPCFVHGKCCNPRPPVESTPAGTRKRCLLATGSTVCAGFSSRGNSSGLAHRSTLSSHAWAAERFFAYEVLLSPYMFGFPFAKERIYSVALSRASIEWVGPPLEQAQQHIIQLFGRKVVASGDIYFSDSPQQLTREANARSPPDSPGIIAENIVDGINWKSLLSPCYQQIWDKYMNIIEAEEIGEMPLHFDCHQNPDFGMLSPEIRSFTGHSDIVSVQRKRFMSCSELLQVHGIRPDSRLGKHFAKLGVAAQHSTAGNGVHFAVVGFFASWVLAYARPRAEAAERTSRSGDGASGAAAEPSEFS